MGGEICRRGFFESGGGAFWHGRHFVLGGLLSGGLFAGGLLSGGIYRRGLTDCRGDFNRGAFVRGLLASYHLI